VAHYRGVIKYLIKTIPDPEAVEDVYDYDDNDLNGNEGQYEKSIIEKINEM
jgi:hypothetical protein